MERPDGLCAQFFRRTNSGGGGRAYTLATFPLRLAYARTAHSSQGNTITGRVFIHVRSAFALGIVYVMLSRMPQRYTE